jgi:type 1 fimbria pilin
MKQTLIKPIMLSLLAGYGLLHAAPTWAVVTCTPSPGIPRVDTVTLSPGVISAGADFRNGTILFSGQWLGRGPGNQIYCTANPAGTPENPVVVYYNYGFGINSAPKLLSSWNSAPFAGAVYQTNIPGVGVALSRGANSVAVTLANPSFSITNGTVNIPGSGTHYAVTDPIRYLSLIKIGNLVPGSYTIDAASLPSAKLFFDNPSNGLNVSGFPITTNIINFQGSLTITAPTCTTPDVNVDLGTHEIHKTLTGKGSATPWVTSDITLTNCPIFHGYYNATNSTVLFDYGNDNIQPADSLNNNIGVRLTPTTSIINGASGIMSLSASADSATGVGIQIAAGDSGNPVLFNFAQERKQALPKDGTTTLKVPLVARYIQTEDRVTPGRADGKVTFTINYY